VPHLSRITIHPIKSLDPVTVLQTRIVEGGGLEHDRELGFFDDNGKFVNGKRTPKVHLLRSFVDWKDGSVRFEVRDTGAVETFHLHKERHILDDWLSCFFEMPVHLRQNVTGGFPDDLKAPGPTLIGSSTLREVSSWYAGAISETELRVRFRANLEISDAVPFWEDRLFAAPDQVVRFRVGDVEFEGTNPCQRCIVPTRDTKSGEQFTDFAQIFRERRQQTLPDWANAERFNHFYRLAVNTCVPVSEIGKTLRVGDAVILT
jgi:uncharacterized protein YcbX